MVGSAPGPHDLLWGFADAHLTNDAPAWCAGCLQDGPPVVVRRAPPRCGWVPVGLRGRQRGERYATWLPLSALTRVVRPEALVAAALIPSGDLPVWQALTLLRPFFERTGLAWGVVGSAGFQLATGQLVVHADSDLDLLLRTPHPFSQATARHLLSQLDTLPCRIDVQLQTPSGGVALAEWAKARGRVMVKTLTEPLLLSDPWKEAR